MEHHKKIIVEENLEEIVESKNNSTAKLLAGSIIFGAILISASIFYNTNLIVKKPASLQGLSGAVVPNTAQQQAQPVKPTGPVTVAERSSAPVMGKSNAKVTIVEFSDFQCPFCQNFFKNTYPEIKAKYIDTGKVKIVFRHFPLSFHTNAQISGVAGECANVQGKFWEYHDLLFQNGQADGTNLDKVSLQKFADQLGLNNGSFGFGKNKFNQCLDNNSTLDIVKADAAEGAKIGVTGTPTFYINGIQLVGAQPFSAFETAIEAALK